MFVWSIEIVKGVMETQFYFTSPAIAKMTYWVLKAMLELVVNKGGLLRGKAV